MSHVRAEAEGLLLPPGEIGPAILRPDGTVFARDRVPDQRLRGRGTPRSITSSAAAEAGRRVRTSPTATTPATRSRRSSRAATFWSSASAASSTNATERRSPRRRIGGRTAAAAADGPDHDSRILATVVLYTPTGSPKASWAAEDQERAQVSWRAVKRTQISGTQFNGSVAGDVVRRRVPKRDELSARAHHEQGDRPRLLRPHARPQRDGRRDRHR